MTDKKGKGLFEPKKKCRGKKREPPVGELQKKRKKSSDLHLIGVYFWRNQTQMVMNATVNSASGRVKGQVPHRQQPSEGKGARRIVGNFLPRSFQPPFGGEYFSSAGCDCCNHFPEESESKRSDGNDSLTFLRNHPTHWFG